MSESRETTFDSDIADPREIEGALRRLAARAVRRPGAAGPPRPHDRDQGPPRRLDDGHAGAHDRRRPTNDAERGRASWRVELLREYAPAAAGAPARRARRLASSTSSRRTRPALRATSSSSRSRTRVRAMDHADVAGQRLHYLRRGEGEPLLLIQGMSGTHLSWGEPFLAALEARLRADRLRPPRRRPLGAASTGGFTIADLADDAAGAARRARSSRARTCSASRWAGWSPRSSRCAIRERVRTLTLGCTYCGGPGSRAGGRRGRDRAGRGAAVRRPRARVARGLRVQRLAGLRGASPATTSRSARWPRRCPCPSR